MDYKFTEQQEMFRRQVRDFLRKECPVTLVREIEEKKLDYSPELYRKMADLGWLGLMIPMKYGGVESNWVDTTIFYEEAGRALLPSPHYSSVILGGQLILAFGSEAQKQEFLPKIANGEIVLTLALTEPEAGSQLDLLTTKATPDKNVYVINGTKLFISYAHIADYIITVAREGDGNALSLFLVKKGSPGLNCVPLDTLSGERLCEVTFEKVKVSAEGLLGKVDQSEKLTEIVNKAKVMSCAEIIGGAQAALEMTVDYSKQRIAYDRPIGSFQALQHKMVDMAIAAEGTRWLVYYVAWLNSQGIPCANEMAMLHLQAGQLYSWLTSVAIHIHGTVSLVRDHDLTLYYRRAKAAQLNLGSAESLKEIIAQGVGV